jgi:ribosomal protein L40E
MIFPDEYIDDYYTKILDRDLKPKNTKYSNLNYGRLTADRKLVQINVDVYLNENFIVRDQIDWDLYEEKKSPELFANVFVNELSEIIDQDMIEYNKRNIREQILDQLLEHIEKNTFFPRVKLIKKENEATQNSQLCINCNSIIFNPEFCINCMYVFEKKIEKKANNEEKIDDSRQTERQKILEFRQKNINVDELSVTFSQEGREKKVCRKCGEMNATSAGECKNCKHKFPLTSFSDANVNLGYAHHFWNKVNKNSTVQQLKKFSEFFTYGDTQSLKYLYNKIKYIFEKEYKEILTEDAYNDLLKAIEKIYFSFSNPTLTVSIILTHS